MKIILTNIWFDPWIKPENLKQDSRIRYQRVTEVVKNVNKYKKKIIITKKWQASKRVLIYVYKYLFDIVLFERYGD